MAISALDTLSQRANKASMLTKERELELVHRWKTQKDENACTELVDSHLRLIFKIARFFGGQSREHLLDDIVCAGVEGFLYSLERYDPSHGTRVNTYAQWSIKQFIRDFLAVGDIIVKPPQGAVPKRIMERGIRSEIEGIPRGHTSLNIPAFPSRNDDEGVELIDLLVSHYPDQHEVVAEEDAQAHFRKTIEIALSDRGILTDREAIIIRGRRLSEPARTLGELGDTYGISKERVRQIENRSLQKLLVSMKRNHPEIHGLLLT